MNRTDQLSPLPLRLAAFAALVFIAVGSIWLIDQRAIQRQAELEQIRLLQPTENENEAE